MLAGIVSGLFVVVVLFAAWALCRASSAVDDWRDYDDF